MSHRAPRPFKCAARPKKLRQIIMSSRDNKMVRRQNGVLCSALIWILNAARNNHIKRGRARSHRRADNCSICCTGIKRKNPLCRVHPVRNACRLFAHYWGRCSIYSELGSRLILRWSRLGFMLHQASKYRAHMKIAFDSWIFLISQLFYLKYLKSLFGNNNNYLLLL